jgi:hypothetical protein
MGVETRGSDGIFCVAGIVYASDRAELVKVTKLTMTAGSKWTARGGLKKTRNG